MRRERVRGYTLLVEALISFSLFLVASIAFYAMVANTHKAEAKARRVMAATAYAREVLETERAKGYTNLSLGKSTGSAGMDAVRGDRKSNIAFTHTVQVTNGPVSGIKSILVEVTWSTGRVTLEDYVGE